MGYYEEAYGAKPVSSTPSATVRRRPTQPVRDPLAHQQAITQPVQTQSNEVVVPTAMPSLDPIQIQYGPDSKRGPVAPSNGRSGLFYRLSEGLGSQLIMGDGNTQSQTPKQGWLLPALLCTGAAVVAMVVLND